MAANILNSKQAVEMSVFVVRAFLRLRQMLATTREFANQIKEWEKRLETHDGTIQEIIQVIKGLLNPPPSSRKKIGFALPAGRTG